MKLVIPNPTYPEISSPQGTSSMLDYPKVQSIYERRNSVDKLFDFRIGALFHHLHGDKKGGNVKT